MIERGKEELGSTDPFTLQYVVGHDNINGTPRINSCARVQDISRLRGRRIGNVPKKTSRVEVGT